MKPWMALLLLLASSTVEAHPAPKPAVHTCRPSCTHKNCGKPDTVVVVRYVAPAPKPEVGVYDQLLSGLTLSTGFRWETEHAHQIPCAPPPPVHVRDPFYLGVGLHLPLSDNLQGFGEFDRDWTEAPHWQVRTGLEWSPFKRGGE